MSPSISSTLENLRTCGFNSRRIFPTREDNRKGERKGIGEEGRAECITAESANATAMRGVRVGSGENAACPDQATWLENGITSVKGFAQRSSEFKVFDRCEHLPDDELWRTMQRREAEHE